MDPKSDQAPIKPHGAQGTEEHIKGSHRDVISKIETGKLCRTNHLVSSTANLQGGET